MTSNGTTSSATPDALQQRANTLLADLLAYQTCLQTHNKQADVEIRTFRKGIEAEVKALHTSINSTFNTSTSGNPTEFEQEELESKRTHALRSSNLPFYEAVWRIALNCDAVIALQRKVFCDVKSTLTKGSGDHMVIDGSVAKKSRTEKQTAIIDIVARNGLEWIKVSTITEKRLLFEMAKEGWGVYGGDYSDSEDYDSDGEVVSTDRRKDETNQLELVKLAKVLYAASRQERARFRRPRVRFIFTKLSEGVYDDIDAVIADIRAIGIQVTCEGGDMEREFTNLSLNEHTQEQQQQQQRQQQQHEQQRSIQLTHLLPSPSLLSHPSTPTLNIDCTILLALISDISHIPTSKLPPFPDNVSKAYHKTISRQISVEDERPLLPHEIYPYLTDRKLICTSHAAQRMREIVQTMGTKTERVRADIILGEGSRSSVSRGDLCVAMQEFSHHLVPVELQLPIQVVEFNYGPIDSDAETYRVIEKPPDTSPGSSAMDIRVMRKLSQKMALSSINSSVFLYGWCQGIVTVTSNRVVASGIIKCINEVLDEEEAEAENGEEAEHESGVEARNGAKSGREASVSNGNPRKEPDEQSHVECDSKFQFQGPKIYVCETARSLIGKEKQTKIHRE